MKVLRANDGFLPK